MIASAIPNNAGSLDPIRVSAPEGCILNAPRPHAVAVRHVIGQMLPDVVLGCLENALPGKAPAEGSSSLWNPMMTGGPGLLDGEDYGDATPFSVTIFHSGGTGARPAHHPIRRHTGTRSRTRSRTSDDAPAPPTGPTRSAEQHSWLVGEDADAGGR